MSTPFEAKIFVFSIVGLVLMVPIIVVNDLIIRNVCRREGRTYSILWIYDSRWLWRTFKPSWFAEAKDAGYLVPYSVLFVAWIGYIVTAIYFFSLKPT